MNTKLSHCYLPLLIMVLLCSCQPDDPATGGTQVALELPVANDINVLIISFDAFRQDNLAAYGNRLDLTPNMDAFAQESVVFLNAYTAGQVTPSSFAAVQACFRIGYFGAGS